MVNDHWCPGRTTRLYDGGGGDAKPGFSDFKLAVEPLRYHKIWDVEAQGGDILVDGCSHSIGVLGFQLFGAIVSSFNAATRFVGRWIGVENDLVYRF